MAIPVTVLRDSSFASIALDTIVALGNGTAATIGLVAAVALGNGARTSIGLVAAVTLGNGTSATIGLVAGVRLAYRPGATIVHVATVGLPYLSVLAIPDPTQEAVVAECAPVPPAELERSAAVSPPAYAMASTVSGVSSGRPACS